MGLALMVPALLGVPVNKYNSPEPQHNAEEPGNYTILYRCHYFEIICGCSQEFLL